jgi:hypothetical protein
MIIVAMILFGIVVFLIGGAYGMSAAREDAVKNGIFLYDGSKYEVKEIKEK